MTTAWKKVSRDLWQESTRTILVVLAMAVGISGFAAMLASYAILTRELNNGYLATNPASATLRTDSADAGLLAAIGSTPGVRDVEARRSVSGRIRGGTQGWRNLMLFVVDDFARVRVSKLNREQGAWPPATGEILIERDAMQVARVRIGDSVRIHTRNGTEQTLRVSGTVHDVGQAQARMENIVYAYITLGTLQFLGEEPVLDQVKFVVDGDSSSESHIRDVVGKVTPVMESRGHPVRRVDIPPPGKHPHADIMGLLMLAFACFGLFVMILSGVIVVNLLTALMAAQIRQIGVMKAIGGTRSQIARIYFALALLMGVAAIAIAIPAGVWFSRILCRAMAVFLNFDITSFAIPAWVFLLVGVVGILVPILAAAYPVWNGSRVPVRVALADFGVASQSFGASWLDRKLAGVNGFTRPLLLAIRNNFRRRARLALTVVTLAAGGVFFMTALNVRASMIETLDRLFATKKYDLAVNIAGMAQIDEVSRIVRGVPGIRNAEYWVASEASLAGTGVKTAHAASGGHATSGGGLHGSGGAMSADRFIVIALPPQTALYSPNLIRGRWLLPGESDTIVINSALAARSAAMRVGESATFPMGPGTVTFRVAGIANEPFSPPMAYIPRAFFDERMGHTGITNHVRVVLDHDDVATIERTRGLLEERLQSAGVTAASITSKGESRFGFDQHMLMIYVALIIMSAMIGAVGGLGLMTTMSLNVLERRREMGILRAIGATPRAVLILIVAEGAVVGVISWILAGAVAWPLSRAVGNLLVTMMFKSALDFSFALRGLFIWLAVSLLLGAAASFIPAWHATRHPVREALGYE